MDKFVASVILLLLIYFLFEFFYNCIKKGIWNTFSSLVGWMSFWLITAVLIASAIGRRNGNPNLRENAFALAFSISTILTTIIFIYNRGDKILAFKFIRQLITKSRISLEELENMNGYEFEEYVANLLRKHGYTANVTPKSGDGGADIIAKKTESR